MRPLAMAGAAAVFAVAAVGLGRVHPFGDPHRMTAADAAAARAGLLRGAAIPTGAREVLVNKCADCHSVATRWPASTYAAPVSWLTEKDVLDGRAKMNLSHWLELSDDQREVLQVEIASQAKKGAMPLGRYTVLHPEAKLTSAEVAELVALAPSAAGAGPVAQGDAAAGGALFARRCEGCHSIDKNGEGPALRGVYGRKAAVGRDFGYSAALKGAGVVWTEANLDRWLRDSDEMVPQSAMGFAVPKAQDRADLVAFLNAQR